MATTYLRPGVYVEEIRSASVTTPTPNNTPAVAAFIGSASQGPTNPVAVTSWRQFVTLFGDVSATTKLGMQVRQFFINNGRIAYVQRLVVSSWAAATRILVDRAGTPLNTLTVSAISKGGWGNNLSISVSDGQVTTGVGATFNLGVWLTNSQGTPVNVENYTEVNLDPTSARYVVTLVNSNSNYVSVVDNASATAAPNNRPALTSGSNLALSGGTEVAALSSTEWSAAFATDGSAPLDQFQNSLIIVLAGVQDLGSSNATTVYNSAIGYAAYRKDAFVIADTPSGSTPSAATTFAASLTNSDRVAVYYPWIKIPDPLSNAAGAVRLISPVGAVAGIYQYNDAVKGVWKNPAGIGTSLQGVVATETVLSPTNLDSLNSSTDPVCAIRPATGAGIIISGARTLDQTSYGTNYIGGRRTLIALEKDITDAIQWAVFETNDQTLWAQLKSTVEGILTPLWLAGGLKGTTQNQAFIVTCDATVNTPSVIDSGEVIVEVAVALQKPAEFVVLRVGQTQSGTAVTYVG